VIPLSTNSGLIGWVPHCDTLHTLIRDYREKKKILLNIEHRIMLRVNLVFCYEPWYAQPSSSISRWRQIMTT
jgi:phosphatidylinositol kinase/protein kinase (PI-3  family)